LTRAGLRDAIRIVTAALALSGGLSCDLFVSLGGLTNGQCPSGKKPCNGTCVSSSSTLYGCGSATDCSPCVLPNAADTICDRDNACAASLCVMPYKTCPLDPIHPGACATDTAHDANNCGDCSVRCQGIANGIPKAGHAIIVIEWL